MCTQTRRARSGDDRQRTEIAVSTAACRQRAVLVAGAAMMRRSSERGSLPGDGCETTNLHHCQSIEFDTASSWPHSRLALPLGRAVPCDAVMHVLARRTMSEVRLAHVKSVVFRPRPSSDIRQH